MFSTGYFSTRLKGTFSYQRPLISVFISESNIQYCYHYSQPALRAHQRDQERVAFMVGGFLTQVNSSEKCGVRSIKWWSFNTGGLLAQVDLTVHDVREIFVCKRKRVCL